MTSDGKPLPYPSVLDTLLEDVPPAAPAPEPKVAPYLRRVFPKLGRNEHCPCGSGLKAKRCCLPQFERRINALSNPRA